jgi:GNAT superfamily N-acetyltransferase
MPEVIADPDKTWSPSYCDCVRIEITEPRTNEEFEQYYRVRYDRLRKDYGLPERSERDHPAEPASNHVIAKLGGRVVGAACWAVGLSQRDGERQIYVRFRQLAVEREFDERGIGIALSRHVEQRAREIGAKEIVGNARVERVPYFESLGYEVRGEGETLFGVIEHVAMAKTL